MKLIITRHGETEENKAGIIMGHLHGTLSENGKEQAKKVALRLKEEKIDAIYSSDLARSSDTAKEIAKYHPKTPLIFAKDLREKYLGKYLIEIAKKGDGNMVYYVVGDSRYEDALWQRDNELNVVNC